MRKPKFRVGDKVKVLRKSTEEEHDLWFDAWVFEMNGFIGNGYVIQECITYGKSAGVEYPKYRLYNYKCNRNYNFPEFVLQKDIVVGQQLLFDFVVEQ